MTIKIESLSTPHDVAVCVQDALQKAGAKLAEGNDPHPQRWIEIARRLRVGAKGITKQKVFYSHMDEPIQSWEIPVLIDPEQSPMYPVYELMTEAELLLEDSHEDSFLLVPALLSPTA